MKKEYLIPASQDVKIDTDYLYDIAPYIALQNLTKDQIAKLFDSKYAYAEQVRLFGWKANKFYGEENYDPNAEFDFVKITIYDIINAAPCPKCGVIYRYLNFVNLNYECNCKGGIN